MDLTEWTKLATGKFLRVTFLLNGEPTIAEVVSLQQKPENKATVNYYINHHKYNGIETHSRDFDSRFEAEEFMKHFEDDMTGDSTENKTCFFRQHPYQVCYIPEHVDDLDDYWTWNDILQICDGNVKKADIVFSLCEWQSPSTVFNELEREDEGFMEL